MQLHGQNISQKTIAIQIKLKALMQAHLGNDTIHYEKMISEKISHGEIQERI
jgi:hypothetical protein